ncbi:MAG: hypothetical protein ING75_17300 [Rhodocyclaceae bacterium]|nr:hypothetical protein [Rhodocyclaceae bacterium]
MSNHTTQPAEQANPPAERKYVIMLWEDWIEKYKPITNPLDDNASWDGFGFETYGPEIDYVREFGKKPGGELKAWTVVDVDGKLIVSSGFHFVNRLNYILTEVPFAEAEDIDVYDELSDIRREYRKYLVPPLPKATRGKRGTGHSGVTAK